MNGVQGSCTLKVESLLLNLSRWEVLRALKRVLSRRKATLKWFEERMKGEELNRVNIYNFYLPIMAIEKLPIDGEWAYV